jgi:HTH-type transcriptional regulator / antitoxin HipB
MKILYLIPGLVYPTFSVYPFFTPDTFTQKKKDTENNNLSIDRSSKFSTEKNHFKVCMIAKINEEAKTIMSVDSGISEWGNSYDHKTRCEMIKRRTIDSFDVKAKNGYPVICAAKQLNTGSNMIQNEHQYKISQGKIKEIEQSLDQLYKEKNSLHPRQFKMRESGLQGILAEVREEIEKYDALKEKPMVIEIESFAEIPVALIKARIALGMTQKDLAEKLGMKEQQIQRYEANQYGSAGFHRLTEVAEALEVTLNSSLLTLRN